MLQILAALSVAAAGGLFVTGVGTYLYIRFVAARRGSRGESTASRPAERPGQASPGDAGGGD